MFFNNNYNKKDSLITCINCEQKGHTFRECLNPIVSNGVLAFKIIDGEIHYLLIQRKDSISYIDFVRGKYSTEFKDTFQILLGEMCEEERTKLLTLDFDTQWDLLWKNHNSRVYIIDYPVAKEKYNKLDIKMLVEGSSPCKWKETENGIAKGRRFNKEKKIDCAIREFNEETGYNNKEITLLPVLPIEELFYGSNSIAYRHTYYLAEIKTSRIPEIDQNNIHMSGEIKALKWMNFKDTINSFRIYNSAKRSVIYKANNIIKKIYNI
jgi:8-oxo-dGTP pyrophosphatase MutT (NUDIX family)